MADDKRQELLQKHCAPCESKGGVPPLSRAQAREYLEAVPGWELGDDAKRISREHTFGNFAAAVAFVNKVADVAEQEGHHPDIHIFYHKVRLELWTHAIGGLSENDFILAAKIDTIASH